MMDTRGARTLQQAAAPAAAYTAAELGQLLGMTKRGMNHRATREDWLHRPRQSNGGGREYPFGTLPEDIKLAIISKLAESKPRPQPLPQDLDERSRDRALCRIMILRLFDAWRASRPDLKNTESRTLFCAAYRANEIENTPDWLRAGLPRVSPNSLLNWRAALDNGGAARLSGSYGKRRGQRRISSDPEVVDLIRGLLYKHPQISCNSILEALTARLPEDRVPAERTLNRWVAEYRREHESLLLSVANPDGWRSKCLAATGDASAHVIRLNQVWEYDSTVADVMLADNRRHVIVAIIDVYSRRVRFLVSRSSKASAVAALTRRCMLEWGVPEIAKTDNGSDYVSHHMQRIFGELGIDQKLCTPFQPQQKPHIERVFKTFLHGTFELLDGFVGHNVIDRKAIESRRSFAARLRKKKYKDTPVELRLTAEELQSFCDEWAVNMYERREHGSLGMSPMQRAAGWTGPVRRIENERALDVLLRPAPSQDGWRTVGKKGVQAGYYYDHPSLRVEALVPGGRVRVLLDETDAARVTCFNERGEWVCDAICPELAGVSREELAAAVKRAQKKALAEDRKDLRGAAKRAQVDTILTDIRRKAATDAAKVTPLPHRSESYSTPALEEAARAADAGATPKAAPLTEAQQKSHEELVRELAGGGERVVQLPPMKDERKARFLRAWRIEQRIEAGQAVDTEEALWLGRYQATPEYKSMRGIFEDFGVEAFN